MATALAFLLWILILMLFLTGLLGSVIPVLPGPPLVFLGIFIYAWHTEFEIISWGWLGFFAGLTGVGVIIDYVFSTLAPRKVKASWWAVLGAVVGLCVGVFFSLPGIVLGPLAGAILFEWIHTRRMDRSMMAGISTVIGLIAGTAVKLGIAVTMLGIFFFRIFR